MRTSLSRGVWTLPAGEIEAALAAEPMTAVEITARLRVLRVTYYAPPMTDEERKGWIATWVTALDGIPRPFAAAAFEWWAREGTHLPAPGHIRAKARELMGEARQALRLLRPPERPKWSRPSEEEIARRREFAERLARCFGILAGPGRNGEAGR